MATFLESKLPPSIGFDPAFPWLMVGENDVQYVDLEDRANLPLSLQGGGASSTHAAIDWDIPLSNALRQIGIRGIKKGKDLLTAGSVSGIGAAQLAIDVLPKRKLSIQFYSLSDEAGHRTHRTHLQAEAML